MKKVPVSFIIAAAVMILLFSILLIVAIPYFFQPPQFSGSIGATFGSQTVLAKVTDIVDEGQINLNGKDQLYQVMRVQVL